MNTTMCYYCKGSGTINAMGQEQCQTCYGSGRNMQSSLMGYPCRTCNGSGKVSYNRKIRCNHCGGTGKQRY